MVLSYTMQAYSLVMVKNKTFKQHEREAGDVVVLMVKQINDTTRLDWSLLDFVEKVVKCEITPLVLKKKCAESGQRPI